MQLVTCKIFDDESLMINDLSEQDNVLSEIMDKYIYDIEHISKLGDEQIKNMLMDSDKFEENSSEFKLCMKNLLYLKQSYFIDTNDKSEVNSIDMEILKNIKIEDLVDINDIKLDRDLNISIDNISKVVDKICEENEKWKEYNIQNTISKYIGIPESEVTYISNLSQYVSFLSELDNAVNYVSRGQKDCTYELLPSLHRKHKKDYRMHSDEYEEAFKQKIIYYDKEIKNRSNEELRAEGQHFGLPTEYLDFTEAHLISLLFAIEDYGYTEQHSIVYFIDSVSYNAETIKRTEKLVNYSDTSAIDNCSKFSARSFFIKVGNSNERIHFQKGCFLKVSSEDKDEFKEKLKKYCKVVVINKNAKKEILKELFNLGITFENIYPDKDNVVKSIKFYHDEIVGGNL